MTLFGAGRGGAAFGIGVAQALLPSACATTPPSHPEPKSTVGAPELERFLPLRDKTVYAYRTRDANTGEEGILVQEVSRPRKNRAELRVAGRVRLLDISEREVRYSDGGILLGTPLERGAVWQGQSGPVEVTAVDLAVQVPAGRYSGCLETRETANPSGTATRIKTDYCPDVGVVRVEVEGSSGQEFLHEMAELMSFGPRVDVATKKSSPLE